MIYDLSTSDISEIRRLMLAGARSVGEAVKAQGYVDTIARALGERDFIARSLEAWKEAFASYSKRIDELLVAQSLKREEFIEIDPVEALR